MYLIYYNQETIAHAVFGISLLLMLSSLAVCAFEVYLSNKALFIQLKDIEHLVN
jgi:hypothetical protein